MTGWDTPWGKNHRYTIEFHHLARLVGSLGGARPLRESLVVRVITPHGEPTAIAVAATWLASDQPDLRYEKVTVTGVEADFTAEPGDLRDDASRAR